MKKENYVLVTGATSGIGFQIAKIFAEKGYNLVLSGRKKEKLKNAKIDLHYFNKKNEIETICADLSREDSAKNIFMQIKEKEIVVDILVNNAGFGIYGEHVFTKDTELQKMINVNITGLTQLCKFFGEEMKRRRNGKILNIASVAAFQPTPYFAAYAASKSYVLNFSEAIAMELKKYNVTVSCFAPGPTGTKFFEKARLNNNPKGYLSVKNRMSVDKAAKIAVKSILDNKFTVVPGFKNKFLLFANRLFTRRLIARMSNKVSKPN